MSDLPAFLVRGTPEEPSLILLNAQAGRAFKTLQARYRRTCGELKTDATLGARGDAYDGVRTRHLRRWANQDDTGGRISLARIQQCSRMNAWTLCMTYGFNSAAHHRLMRDGDPSTGYAGSSDRHFACEFDLHLLTQAIHTAIQKHENCDITDQRTMIFTGQVQYTSEPEHVSNPNELMKRPRTDKDVAKPLFYKRPLFSTEQEFRFVLNIQKVAFLPEDSPGMALKSLLISNAVVGFHHLKSVA